jgi:hypothetical protein
MLNRVRGPRRAPALGVRAMLARCLAPALLLSLAAGAAAGEGGEGGLPSIAPRGAAFTFVRLEYDSVGGYGESFYFYDGRYWLRWETDFPQADRNFLHRFRQLTTTDPHMEAVTRRLTDGDIFDYPFVYACDVGWMQLTTEEGERLREYLLKGGFLWIDDFWGTAEWRNLETVFARVFPDRRFEDIPPGHPILSTVFPLEAAPQVPARDFAYLGRDEAWVHRYPAEPLEPVNLRGVFDDHGRLMAVATHNTDIGDGFEREAYGEAYFETYSKVAYAMGVNIVVYALSH